MAVHERTATYFPTFTRAADVVRAETTGYVVAVWSVAVVVLAVLHTVITLAASYWRYAADAAAHDGAVAAVDRFNALASQLGDEWGFQPPGPPALDLDAGAALGQVIAATASFGVLLAVALVLLAHGRIASAYVAAATTGVSVATMAGLLARTSPMIPTDASADPAWLNLDQYPQALRQARIDMDAALVAQDTATWWNYAVAAVVALVALAAVEVCRRRGLVYPAPASAPVLVDVIVVVVVLGGTALLLGSRAGRELDGDRHPALRRHARRRGARGARRRVVAHRDRRGAVRRLRLGARPALRRVRPRRRGTGRLGRGHRRPTGLRQHGHRRRPRRDPGAGLDRRSGAGRPRSAPGGSRGSRRAPRLIIRLGRDGQASRSSATARRTAAIWRACLSSG